MAATQEKTPGDTPMQAASAPEPGRRRVVASVVMDMARDVADGVSDAEAVAAAEKDLMENKVDGFTRGGVVRVRSIGVQN
jgi:undecaprenyl pyrophosphate synthase